MIKKFFQKFGIYLSENQKKLMKWVFYAYIMSFLGAGISQTFLPPSGPQCIQAIPQVEQNITKFLIALEPCFGENGTIVLIIVLSIFVIGVLPMLVTALIYLSKLIINKKFREQEMTQSVNFLEKDEREQFVTMRATRRAYMILNFALMIGWLYNLVFGSLNAAFWFFLIQAIGALSFRSQIGKINQRG